MYNICVILHTVFRFFVLDKILFVAVIFFIVNIEVKYNVFHKFLFNLNFMLKLVCEVLSYRTLG